MRALAGLALVLASCAAAPGECDPARAEQVVFRNAPEGSRDRGRPAYAGQALLVESCGAGSFCHAGAAVATDRYGVPIGLDLDVRIACPDDDVCQPAEVARLTADRERALDHSAAILASVASGAMPPGGEAGRRTRALGGRHHFASGAPLPGLETPEGQAILRAWLACGAPVVERSAPPRNDEPAGTPCDLPTSVGACLTREP